MARTRLAACLLTAIGLSAICRIMLPVTRSVVSNDMCRCISVSSTGTVVSFCDSNRRISDRTID